MRGLIVATVLSFTSIAGVGAEAGPTCNKGCPCGNACISCSKECHVGKGTARKAADKPAPKSPPAKSKAPAPKKSAGSGDRK